MLSSSNLINPWSAGVSPARGTAATISVSPAQAIMGSAGVPPAGSPVGRADLQFAPRAGRTRMVRSYTSPPFAVQRTLYLDPALPDLAVAFLTNVGAGVLEDDRLDISITAREGARALVTSRSATKLFSMPGGEAVQQTNLLVEPGALLEYLPDPVIPFRASSFSQHTSITVRRGGTLVYTDVLGPGRLAHGERFAYDSYAHALTVRDETGLPLYHEAFRLKPADGALNTTGLFGRQGDTLGTLIAVVPDGGKDLVQALSAGLQASGSATAVSALPAGEGAVVKVLGQGTSCVTGPLALAWSVVRQSRFGCLPTDLRKATGILK